MPLYEYRCRNCGALIEVLQKHGEKAPKICEECGAKNVLMKEVSASAFHLKGGGWYKDLYSSTPKKDSKKGESKSKKTKSEGSSKKADSKAAKD